MGYLTPVRPGRQADTTNSNPINDLSHIGSKAAVAIAAICATGLVICSAGFGALYAWNSGSQHGLMLGVLSVAMAVALEGAKPLAVAAAFAAFRSWAIVRGALLTLLAVAAIAFSLVSELSLIGGSRGDLTAKRTSVVEQNDNRRARLQSAQRELTSLPPSRSKAEIEADVTRLLARNPDAGNCKTLGSATARWVCPKVATFKGEIARTEKRTELQAVIDKLTEGMPSAGSVKTADPASSALSTYLLTVLGVEVSAATLAEWLLLVPVLGLELGAALAMVLVQAVGGRQEGPTVRPEGQGTVDTRKPKTRAVRRSRRRRTASAVELQGKDTPAGRGRGRPAKARVAAERKIVDTLKAKGGRLSANSTRALGKMLTVRKSTMHAALTALLAAGVVARIGSELILTG